MIATCATSALRTLPQPVLMAIRTMCQTARAQVVIIKAQKQALQSALNLTLVPIQAKRELLTTVVTTARNAARVVPAETIALCPELGQINIMLEQAISAPITAAFNLISEADRITSIVAEVGDEVDRATVALDFFDDMITSIDSVLAE